MRTTPRHPSPATRRRLAPPRRAALTASLLAVLVLLTAGCGPPDPGPQGGLPTLLGEVNEVLDPGVVQADCVDVGPQGDHGVLRVYINGGPEGSPSTSTIAESLWRELPVAFDGLVLDVVDMAPYDHTHETYTSTGLRDEYGPRRPGLDGRSAKDFVDWGVRERTVDQVFHPCP